ncbi:S8 family serine peptidase [Agromyces sp. CFH 90414]|uniref:S8 family serine peptidase n=1 Tax=Agromyces agglutinans TaxID=2662258 RepID=A0A6I2F940_9MICO|nr:S8/S53 family peptidase [Agromyces agglutinans]MRG58876.1 S8 family serine peptidase [Agromyces agglutinans]
MQGRNIARLAAGVALGAALLAASQPAIGAESEAPGDWYFTASGMQESLDAGNDGAGVQVAVIDGQINPDVPTLQGADLTIAPSICYDEAGNPIPPTTDEMEGAHGTNSVSLIAGAGAGYPGQVGVRGAAPRAQVTYYSVGPDSELLDPLCFDRPGSQRPGSQRGVPERFEQALDDGADIVSIQIESSDTIDPLLVARAMREGVIVLQSLSNEPFDDWGTGGLASMNGVVGVQAIDAYGDPQNGAGSTDPGVDVAAPGVGMTAQGGPGAESWETQTIQSGTSNAVPFTAGVLAAVWSKYPEATGNQMIQSLIRNTGVEDHELARDDSLGYGIVSLRHMLRVDPTQYDDVNPLIVDDRELQGAGGVETVYQPTYLEIFPEAATPEPTEPPASGDPFEALLPVFVIGGAVGALVLVGAIVLVVVLTTRNKQRQGERNHGKA